MYQTYSLPVGELNDSKATLLNFLDGAIWENAFFFSVREKTFDGAVWE
jgi:hypothetical protein